MTSPDLAVRCASLGFEFGPAAILREVDLDLRAGEFTAILGQNGVGKSTLLRLLAGLLTPRSGRIELFGRDISSMSRREIAQRVALVSQEGSAEGGFTVLELALLGRAPHQDRFGFDSPADLEVARCSLAQVGLEALAHRPMWTLSGGERRRAQLGRALVQQPKVLLLDEPTAFLDLGHQVQVLDLARERARAGMAVVAVLHDPNLAASYANRVVVVEKTGRAHSGSAAEMLLADRLSDLYGIDLAEARSPRIDHPVFAPASAARSEKPTARDD